MRAVPATRRLTHDQAVRVALAAQGFADPRPTGRIDVRHFRRVVDRTALVQLDSVNVLARAHYLPFFARLGAYSRPALDQWLWHSGEMFEYWAHEASLLPVAQRPLLAHRMAGGWHWPGIERINAERPDYVSSILKHVREVGPVRVGDLDGSAARQGWWGWSEAKRAIEYLFLTGQVVAADRQNFTRVYDLPERVLPSSVLDTPAASPDDAQLELLALGARAVGIGTFTDITDYYRLKPTKVRHLLPRLIERGDIQAVTVDGWKDTAYLHREAAMPRKVEARALLAPFDPLVWRRDRTERLFGFHYRIGIYTPAAQRVHGYYVLPFLLGTTLVGRADLKADRKTSRLLVQAAFAEPEVDRPHVGRELLGELTSMAAWLGLRDVHVEPRGDLAQHIR